MNITSTTLLVLVAFAALALPATLALMAARRPDASGRHERRGLRGWPGWRNVRRAAGMWVAFLVAQVLAIAAVGLAVNRQFGFYTSWNDAFGVQNAGPIAIDAGGIDAGSAGTGTTKSFMVSREGSGSAQAIAWLPPGYDKPENASHRYPVVVVLPGYANSVGATYENMEIGRTASQLISSGRTQPFIAVVAPYQTVQGRDTECTNIHKGAQEYTFLTKSVPAAIRANVRATDGPSQWTALGWSTGGYCAAKALYANPSPWQNAISMGGYFEWLQDGTTGKLYPTKNDKILNSPSELYRRYQMPSTRMLIVASRADRDTWKSSSRMAAMAKNDTNVSSMWLPSGGHNYGTYVPHIGEMIQWAMAAPSRA